MIIRSQRYRFFLAVSLQIIASLCLILGVRPQSALQSPTDPLAGIQGGEAVSYRKDRGRYESLQRAADSLRYQIEPSDPALVDGAAAYAVGNPGQKYHAVFTGEQVALVSRNDDGRSWRLGLRLTGYGYGDRLMKPVAGAIMAEGNRVEISKAVTAGQPSAMGDGSSSLTEWYVNRPDGLEQGFTLARAPGKRREGERLNLKIEVDGNLEARLADDAQAVDLIGAAGERSLRYDHLHAYDAAGRELESRMKVGIGQVRLEVDDRDAVYPLTIDPLFSQSQELFAPDGGPNSFFGEAVAISGDTAVVGAFGAGGNSDAVGNGAAYVFVSAGGAWGLQQKLPAPDGLFLENFGASVAIDGETVVVGAPGVDLTGAAYVFVRAGGVWSQQQKLTASDAASGDDFGHSLAISGDTVVVGSDNKQVGTNVSQGSAYVFVRAGGVWSEQQKLTAADGKPSDFYGNSVAISGDTVVVGDDLADRSGNTDQGVVYVYVRAGGVWSEQQILSASDAAALAHFGASVAITGDTLVAGKTGAAYVFARSSGAWSQQQKLTTSDGPASNFGNSVAVSGETIVVGADQRQTFQGAAYVFVKASGVWSEQQMLIASDGKEGDEFGSAVAIDGETIVVGAGAFQKGNNVDQGSTYIFAPNTPPAIKASSVIVKQGRTVTRASIATVSDNETPAGLLAVSVLSGGTATGITLTSIANSSGVITADVTASCTATGGTVRLLVTDPGGLTGAADLQVNVTPNDPPVISCPADLTVVTAHPGDATAIVSYTPPLVTDTCPVTVGCTPPSGSAFPAGVTTVTCTATDVSGNKASCVFKVVVVNYCLRDNTTGNLLQWSSTTGDYIFTRCKDKFTMSGTGVVSNSGGLATLTDSRADRRISAAFNPGTLTGRANITLILAVGASQTIVVNDTNPAATCACP